MLDLFRLVVKNGFARYLFLLCFLSFFVHSEPLHAQSSVFISGGLTSTVAPDGFTANYGQGYNGSVGVGFPLSDFVMIQATADFSFVPFDSDTIAEDESTTSAKVLSIMANAMFAPNRSERLIRLYAIAGAGYLRQWDRFDALSTAEDGQKETDVETALGLSAGAGLYSVISRGASIFLDARIIHGLVPDGGVTLMPIRVGIVLTKY